MIQDDIVYLKNAGRMAKNLILVEDSVCEIPQRLREINPGYVVMFNPDTQKYEVHILAERYTLELTLPYDELDERAITYALYVRDMQRVRTDIEENNKRLDEAKLKEQEHEKSCKVRDLFTYCNRHVGKETFGDGAYKTREV